MAKTTVLGVKLEQRMSTAPEFQKVVSDHGCNIKTRIGLHHVEGGVCSPSGVILLEVIGSNEDITSLENDLKAIPGTEIQKIAFD